MDRVGQDGDDVGDAEGGEGGRVFGGGEVADVEAGVDLCGALGVEGRGDGGGGIPEVGGGTLAAGHGVEFQGREARGHGGNIWPAEE